MSLLCGTSLSIFSVKNTRTKLVYGRKDFYVVSINPQEIQTLDSTDTSILHVYVCCQCTNVVWPDFDEHYLLTVLSGAT
jgi:hypothetical protein